MSPSWMPALGHPCCFLFTVGALVLALPRGAVLATSPHLTPWPLSPDLIPPGNQDTSFSPFPFCAGDARLSPTSVISPGPQAVLTCPSKYHQAPQSAGPAPLGLSERDESVPPPWQEDSGRGREAGGQAPQQRREGVAAGLTLQPRLPLGLRGWGGDAGGRSRLLPAPGFGGAAREHCGPPGGVQTRFPLSSAERRRRSPTLLARALRVQTLGCSSPRAPGLSPSLGSPEFVSDPEPSFPKPCARAPAVAPGGVDEACPLGTRRHEEPGGGLSAERRGQGPCAGPAPRLPGVGQGGGGPRRALGEVSGRRA